jgi:hypothetical protein
MNNNNEKPLFDTSDLLLAGFVLAIVFGILTVSIALQMNQSSPAYYAGIFSLTAAVSSLGCFWVFLGLTLKLIKVNK